MQSLLQQKTHENIIKSQAGINIQLQKSHLVLINKTMGGIAHSYTHQLILENGNDLLIMLNSDFQNFL